jgi:ribosomal protein L15
MWFEKNENEIYNKLPKHGFVYISIEFNKMLSSEKYDEQDQQEET